MTAPGVQDVPRPFRQPLRQLAELGEADQLTLVDVFRNSRAASFEGLADELALALPAYSRPDARVLVSAIGSLAASFADAGVRASTISQSLANAPSLELSEDAASRLRSVMNSVLATDVLALLGKTQRLRYAHERNYEEAEIVTDLRPVYEKGEQLEIVSMLVWHTMRLRYSNGEEMRTLEFSLERVDLQALSEQVDRALAKEQAVTKRLKLMEMPIALEGDGPND